MPDPMLNRWLVSERIRYLGAFSSIWSSFNDLYRRDSRFTGADREIVNTIQNLPRADPLVVAFETSCARDDQRVERTVRLVQDAATKGVVAYEAQTRLSRLVAEVTSNPILGPLIWIAGQQRSQGRTTRELPCIHVPAVTYFA